MRPEFIVLHHSLTADGPTVSWGAIRSFHTDPSGPYRFVDIGYHWGVELIDGHYEILVGRTMDTPGAHCVTAGMNGRSIGICCVGNFDLIPPPKAQLFSLARVVTYLLEEFNLPRDRVIGHRDAGLMDGLDWRRGQFKTCPGSQFSLEAFREMLPPFTRSDSGVPIGPGPGVPSR